MASVYAIAITPGKLSRRVNIFSESAGHWNIMLMVWIFMLAGAFAGSAKEIGSIEATVNFTLHIIPGHFLLAGLFLTACFVSLAIGTSVGTIVALVPIASGIAQETGMSQAMMTALVVGGSFFGDNLSFISDTTIAATRAVGCAMNEKFRANLMIVLPAVVVVAGYYIFKGLSINTVSDVHPIEWLKLLPYVSVIVLALLGMDVTLVLVIGLLLNAVVGFGAGTLDWFSWLGSMGQGIAGMGEAICNVGACKPEDVGGLYAWGETDTKTEYSYATYKFSVDGVRGNYTKYSDKDSKTVLDQEDDVAHVKWGGSWRVPTSAEMDELRRECNWTWTTENDVKGFRVSGKKEGYENNSIFLPVNAFNDSVAVATLHQYPEYGVYWSSTLSHESGSFLMGGWDHANGIWFCRDASMGNASYRNEGRSIRPVCP